MKNAEIDSSQTNLQKWREEFGPAISSLASISAGLIAISAIASCLLLAANETQHQLMLSENGILESSTAWLYLLVSLILAAIGTQRYLTRRQGRERFELWYPWLLALFVSCFAAREMDFHARFTGGSVLKTSYYLSDQVSSIDKSIAVFVIAAVVVLTLTVFRFSWSRTLTRFRRNEMLGVLPITAFVLVIFSKGIDAVSGSLLRHGFISSGQSLKVVGGIEEISELMIPCVFVTMTVLARRDRIRAAVKPATPAIVDTSHSEHSAGLRRVA